VKGLLDLERRSLTTDWTKTGEINLQAWAEKKGRQTAGPLTKEGESKASKEAAEKIDADPSPGDES